MAHVKSGFAPVSGVGDAVTILRIKNHGALAAIAKGEGTRQDVDIIISSMNIAEALVKMGIGNPHEADMRDAQDAILAMAKRGVEKGDRFVFTGQELSAVNFAMEIYEAQLDTITIVQLEKAVAMVKRIIMGGGSRMVQNA
jgi:hypothetical protein